MLKKTLAVLLAGICVSSFADLINFESVATGNYASLAFENAVLTSDNSTFEVTGSAPWGSNSIINNTHNMNTDGFTLTFDSDVLVNTVSLTVGDYAQDSDPIFLTAYDINNVLVGSTTYTIPESLNGGVELSLSTVSEIAYFKFSSGNPYPGSVYWDNISFNSTSSSVPEPASLSFIGFGLLALALNFRRKK